VVGRHHHHEEGERGVAGRQPAPPAARCRDHRDAHDERPPDVHRWHGRVLVRVEAAVPGVDGLAVARRGVDQAGAGQQPWRRHRDQLDEQAGPGEQGHGVPDPRVGIPVPDVEPDQADPQHGEVQDVVIEVERLYQHRVGQEEPLHARLVRQVQDPLGVPQPAPPAQRPGLAQDRERAGELPQAVQPEQQRGLDGHADPAAQQPPGRQRDHRQAAGSGHRVRPGKHGMWHREPPNRQQITSEVPEAIIRSTRRQPPFSPRDCLLPAGVLPGPAGAGLQACVRPCRCG
jgi:hypothetical protein